MHYDYSFVLHPRAEDFSTPEDQPPVYHELTFHYNIDPGQVGGWDEPKIEASIDECEVQCDGVTIDWPELVTRFDMLEDDVMRTAYKHFDCLGHDD